MKQTLALLAFSAAVFSPLFFPHLLSPALLLVVISVLMGLSMRLKQYWLLAIAVGFLYGNWQASEFQQRVLSEPMNNQIVEMSGYVQGLPSLNGRIWRMVFIAEHLQWDQPKSQQTNLPKKIRLAYYGHLDSPLKPGEKMRVVAKLQRPHGLSNPGLFNYQRWLVGEGFSATGYIKSIHSRDGVRQGFSVIDRWRLALKNRLLESNITGAGILAALIVGDRQAISQEQMSLLVDTGTVHLMAISGLHVGFIAGLGFFFSRWACGCLVLVVFRHGFLQNINSLRWGYLGSLCAAVAYTAAAGFSTPTIRALIMLAAFLLPKLFYLKTSRWWGLATALALIALLEPMAPLQNGFWLSFAAVLLIFLSVDHDLKLNPVFGLARLQLIFLVGFSTMIMMVQGQINLVSLPSNLIAVPMTGLLIVPLAVFGLMMSSLHSEIAWFIWEIAGRLINMQLSVLSFFHEHLSFTLVKSPIPDWLAVVAVLAGLLLFGLKRHWQRLVALVCMMPMFVNLDFLHSGQKWLEVRVFDVGQGLAVLVRQPGYSLLYDTGPRFSEQFDAGADILAPSLAQLRVWQLEDLVISHPDSDHIGGYAGLTQSIGTKRTWISRQHPQQHVNSMLDCVQGIGWQHNDVQYEFLSPNSRDNQTRDNQAKNKNSADKQSAHSKESNNDRSCVLHISWHGYSILLPGDVTSSIEKRLVENALINGPVSLLIAPHHGSKTSSSKTFIDAIQPESVVFSAGYMNRFNHPHPHVVDRYQQVGSDMYSTAKQGMIIFRWSAKGGAATVKTQLEEQIFWWQK